MPDDQLHVARATVSTSGGTQVPVLTAAGELDAASCDDLRAGVEAIASEAADHGEQPGPDADPVAPRVVIADVSAVSYCDSRGLGTIITSIRSCRRRGMSLRLVAPPDAAVPRLLRRVALDQMLDVHDDVEAALAAPSGSPLEADEAVEGGEPSRGRPRP